MGRKKKSVLNQGVKEPVIKEESKEESKGLVYGEDYIEDPTIERTLVEKSPATVLEEVSLKDVKKDSNEISLKVSGEKLAEVLEEKNVEEVEEPVVEEPVVDRLIIIKPSKEQLSSLSKAGIRHYRRTGMLPK